MLLDSVLLTLLSLGRFVLLIKGHRGAGSLGYLRNIAITLIDR